MAAILAAIVAFFTSGTFASFLVAALIQVLVALGVSLTVVKGIDVGIDYFFDMVKGSFNGVPDNIVTVLGMYGFDNCLNMIMTAHLFVLSVKGITKTKILPSIKQMPN
ncbi:DUF2523 family protein [Photobacterium angustum]|uniref:DUF2523 domain-containing protein n=1 Tax=Photobacterium angustum TaxID=661 RepID=A0A855SDN7_PHOAN|nr:DUF2523 family protein [Photobacterium angustum]KJF83153.1 hypothetical protein UB36_00725 [Photobacterium damselae subsp. damselae]KJG47461.1 hypothetical protein UA31_00725 [Photobacterium angustum]KJG49296.1 hypothetical protein UA30_08920 [Photobacterium angustum]KJG53620.1 hypothetical protein UA34_04695 [Photobacterium angustum]PSX07898.1 DUF2523 domain-containing protein [Photobacterium angustum]